MIPDWDRLNKMREYDRLKTLCNVLLSVSKQSAKHQCLCLHASFKILENLNLVLNYERYGKLYVLNGKLINPICSRVKALGCKEKKTKLVLSI